MADRLVTLTLPDKIAARLTTRAALRGIPRANVVTEILDQYLSTNPNLDSILTCSLGSRDKVQRSLYLSCELDDRVAEFSKKLSDEAGRHIGRLLVYRAALAYGLGFS